IGGEGAGIAREILLRPELSGIYEDARDHGPTRAGECPGAPQKRGVAAMKRTHGGDEHQGTGCLPTGPRRGADGADDFQRGTAGRAAKPVACKYRGGRPGLRRVDFWGKSSARRAWSGCCFLPPPCCFSLGLSLLSSPSAPSHYFHKGRRRKRWR